MDANNPDLSRPTRHAARHRLREVADFQERLRDTAGEPLGMRVVSVDENHLAIEMAITDAARQPMGLLHGGVSMLLAETAASLHAGWNLDLSLRVPVGIEIGGSHLQSATEGHVRAVAKVTKRSNRLVFHQVEILHVETGQLLCLARVTNYLKTSPAARGARE